MLNMAQCTLREHLNSKPITMTTQSLAINVAIQRSKNKNCFPRCFDSNHTLCEFIGVEQNFTPF
jgi:hypothetical protein